jgi:hypothetical protein
MTILELKKKLILKINQTENNELLEVMYRLITGEEAGPDIYELSHDQNCAVEEGQQQFETGKFLKGEQADKEIEEWLGS